MTIRRLRGDTRPDEPGEADYRRARATIQDRAMAQVTADLGPITADNSPRWAQAISDRAAALDQDLYTAWRAGRLAAWVAQHHHPTTPKEED